MRRSSDYWSPRQLKWILVVAVVLVGVGGVAIWFDEHEPSNQAFHRYLDAMAAGRMDDAAAQLCPEAREAMPDYVDRLKAALAPVGRIEHRSDIRAGHRGLGAAFIDGSRMDLYVYIRMARVEGHWRPCPTEGPLGRTKPA